MTAGGGGDLLILVAAIVGLGVISQLLSARFRVPSVLFLIASGVAIGPEGLGVLTIDSFGESGLSTIVGLSVAIIVFEGAFHLKISKIKEAPTAVFRLTTIGAAIAFLGTAGAVRFFLEADWDIALLIGALLIATGPTVVTPILKVVPVRDRVAATLETEGIVNDVTAAILAVVLFKSMTIQEIHADIYLQLFAERLGTGLLVGVVVAAAVWALLQYVDLSPDNAPQNARLLTLAGAIIAFGAADYVFAEAGVAAAATAGLILGNANLPYEDEIEAFKGDITLLVLSFVFITLAALLEFDQLLALGLGGVAVVAIVMLVLRPFLVFPLGTRWPIYVQRDAFHERRRPARDHSGVGRDPVRHPAADQDSPDESGRCGPARRNCLPRYPRDGRPRGRPGSADRGETRRDTHACTHHRRRPRRSLAGRTAGSAR